MTIILRFTLSLLALLLISRHELVAQEIHAPTLTISYGTSSNTGTAISPDGRTVIANSGGAPTILFDAVTGDSLRTIEGLASLAFSAAWSPNGEQLLVSSVERAMIVGTDDWEIDLDIGVDIDTAWHSYSAVWSSEGARVAFGDVDSVVRIWDAATGDLLHLHRFGGSIRDVMFTRNDSYLFITLDNGTFHLWDLEADELDVSVKTDQEATGFWNVFGMINPQGTIIATASTGAYLTGEIKLWDAATGDSIGLLEGHTRVAFDFAFSSDGSHLVSAGFDETARLWRMSDRTNTAVFRGHRALITDLDMSANDKRFVTISVDSTVRVWNLGISAAPFEPVVGEGTLNVRHVVPNPARDLVALDVAMARPGDVSVAIVNAVGQIVMEIPAERFATAGERRIVFDIGELPSGTYLCRLSAGEERVVAELQVVR